MPTIIRRLLRQLRWMYGQRLQSTESTKFVSGRERGKIVNNVPRSARRRLRQRKV